MINTKNYFSAEKSRKLLMKKYIDIGTNEIPFIDRNFDTKQISHPVIRKKICGFYSEQKKKIENSLCENQESKTSKNLQNFKPSLSSMKIKTFDLEYSKETIHDCQTSRTLKETINDKYARKEFRNFLQPLPRKGFQGYKFSIINNNRNLIKKRYSKFQSYIGTSKEKSVDLL